MVGVGEFVGGEWVIRWPVSGWWLPSLPFSGNYILMQVVVRAEGQLSETLRFVCDRELHDELRRLAREQSRSVSSVVRQACKQLVAELGGGR